MLYHIIHTDELAAGHGAVGSGNGAYIHAFLVEVFAAFGGIVVEYAEAVVVVEPGLDDVDLADLPFPRAVEVGELHAVTERLGSCAGEGYGGLIAPVGILVRVGIVAEVGADPAAPVVRSHVRTRRAVLAVVGPNAMGI